MGPNVSNCRPKIGQTDSICSRQTCRGRPSALTGEHEEAITHYKDGLKSLNNVDHPETRYRLHLRIGDILQSQRNTKDAQKAFKTAVDGFAKHELPYSRRVGIAETRD